MDALRYPVTYFLQTNRALGYMEFLKLPDFRLGDGEIAAQLTPQCLGFLLLLYQEITGFELTSHS